MVKSRRTGLVRQGSGSSNGGYTYYNKTFDDISDLFLFACSHGDYMLVHRLLDAGEAEADVKNRMGKSALQLSIENEHFEVVRVLLDTIPYEQFRDALLLAIYLGHTKIADFIMNHQTYRTFSGGFLDPTNPQAYDESQFSSDITPLILAAQHNRLQIVHQLLIAGERIKKPHAHMCHCPDCARETASDSFRQTQVRLSAYKGLASEVYIALAYADPILHAFELRHELLKLAKAEHYFCEDYKKLAKQLSYFVARLLDNVRGHDELNIVLNKTGLPHEEKYEKLARFDLAIQYREKPFVSHSNCQQKLMERWYEDLPMIKNAHLPKRVLFYIGYIMCFPFFSIVYYILPQSKIGSLCQHPNLRFKAYIASYFAFISLIFASSYYSTYHQHQSQLLSEYDQSIYTKYVQSIYQNTNLKNALLPLTSNPNANGIDSVVNCDIGLRFMKPNPFQIVIFIWVAGFLWNEFKQIVGSGIRVYLIVPSNYVDCSMNILYVLHFVFLYGAMLCTRTSMAAFKSETYWTQLANYDSLSTRDQQYLVSKTGHLLYWLNADRYYWVNGDLHTLAEAFFAMGNVVSICRVCFLLPVIAFVGPLQIMLERMIIDISKWIAIITIFFVAFACTLFFIYGSFASVLEGHVALTGGSPSSSVPSLNSTANITASKQCSDYFFQLLNQTRPIITDTVVATSADNSNASSDACQQSPNYGSLVKVGPYPGVYYFGRSFRVTLLTIFFTLFGVIGQNGVPDRGYEMITRSCYQPDPNTYTSSFDQFSGNLGFAIYGLFAFICVTVLINTLIAMLEQTIDKIDDRADIEWKFARSKLYMEYIRDGDPLPVPLNIFPSPKAIMKFLHQIKAIIFSKKSVDKKPHQTHREQHVPEHSIRLDIGRGQNRTIKQTPNGNQKNILTDHNDDQSNDKLTYQVVIERIVKRFLLYYQSTHQGLEEIKDGFEFKEIKQDISSFRFEMSHEIDVLDEMCTSLIHTMTIFDQNLQNTFPISDMKSQLADTEAS